MTKMTNAKKSEFPITKMYDVMYVYLQSDIYGGL